MFGSFLGWVQFVSILLVFEVGAKYESSLLEDLQAECTHEGISVKLFFKEPFAGVAYSNGHYETSKCRYISHENQVETKAPKTPSGTNFSFVIPINECGTVYHGGLGTPLNRTTHARHDDHNNEKETYIENTLLVQKDARIQEAGDVAKTLRCVFQKDFYKPLSATLPFRNTKLVSKRSECYTFCRSIGPPRPSHRTKDTLPAGFQFQMKGQVQSVPGYRRHHQRSLGVSSQSEELLKEGELLSEETMPTSASKLISSPNQASQSKQTCLLFFSILVLSLL